MNQTITRTLCSTMALFLPSCATPTRGDVSSALVTPPESWQAASGTGSNEGSVDGNWWRSLGDESLTGAIEQTLARNHDLRAAQARLAAAAGQARLAGAQLWPTLDLGAGATRSRSVFVGLPSGFGGGGPLTNTFNNYGVNLNASWEVDLWGRLGAAKDAGTAELQATAANLRGLRQSLAAQTAKAFFGAVEAKQQIALASTTVASYRQTESQVEDRFRRGVRTALDLRLARSRRMSGEALQHLWQERFESAVRQLQVLQGEYPDGSSTIPDQFPPQSESVPTGLPAELVRRRPDLIAAEGRLAAAGFRVDEAQSSLYPRLSLSGQVGTNSDTVRDLADLDFLIWTAAANLLAPIVDGGRLREQVNIAAAREHEAIAEFAQAALRAYSEVETLLAVQRNLRLREGSLAAAATESAAARTLSEDRYRRGLGEFIAVLEAQRSALLLEGELLTTRRLLLDSRVDLHLALGGGFADVALDPDAAPNGDSR